MFNKNKFNKKEFILRTIKIVDIGYIFSFYSLVGFLISIILNKIFSNFNEEIYKKKSTLRILAEICLQFAIIGVIIYIIRNLFEYIPFFLDNVYGYDHKKTKEIKQSFALIYIIMFLQYNLRDKLLYLLHDRFR